MKIILSLIFSIRFFTALAQTEHEFIDMYNEHIDPKHQLDAFQLFNVRKKLKATGLLNENRFDINDTKICQYFSSGEQKCRVEASGTGVDMSFIPASKAEFKNAIKDELNFISTLGDSTVIIYKVMTDSITVIEKKLGAAQKFIYTFDSKTKDLLQMENIAKKKDLSYSSLTRFPFYQNVKGILVPKRITFSNHFCKATLEFSDVSFE